MWEGGIRSGREKNLLKKKEGEHKKSRAHLEVCEWKKR